MIVRKERRLKNNKKKCLLEQIHMELFLFKISFLLNSRVTDKYASYIVVTPSWITDLSWQRGFFKSIKLLAMPYRATQAGWFIVEHFDKVWSTGGRNCKIFQLFLPKELNEQYEKTKRYDTGR